MIRRGGGSIIASTGVNAIALGSCHLDVDQLHRGIESADANNAIPTADVAIVERSR
jgi:hypothetical protein